MSRVTSSTAKTRTTPPCLSHFVILNPTLRPASSTPGSEKTPAQQGLRDDPQSTSTEEEAIHGDVQPATASPAPEDRDKDLEDDLREAAQILFYTSRSSSSVSRDTMLKQTGLVKGLMGFTDMLISPTRVKPTHGTGAQATPEPFLSIRSSKSRLIVFTPEEGFYICVGITLAMSVEEDGTREVLPHAQGLSDRMLVRGLEKGYEDFRLLHGSLVSLVPVTKASTSTLEKFWTRFALAFENDIISAPPTLDLSIPEYLVPAEDTSLAVRRALEVFIEDSEISFQSIRDAQTGVVVDRNVIHDANIQYGVVIRTGPVYSKDPDTALARYLTSLVAASAQAPAIKVDARSSLGHSSRRDTTNVRDRKTSWGMSMGLGMGWVPTLPGMTPRSVTPVGRDDARSIRSVASGSEMGDVSSASRAKDASASKDGKEGKGKWGFGMPSLGLGEAMGSVGTVFGLGGSSHPADTSKPAPGRSHSNRPSLSLLGDGRSTAGHAQGPQPDSDGMTARRTAGSSDNEGAEIPSRLGPTAEPVVTDAIVTATTVSRPELGERLESSLATEIDTLHLREAAQPAPSLITDAQIDAEEPQAAVEPETAIDLEWEKRTVYLPNEKGDPQRRRLTWVIRDEVLLYLVHPSSAQPSEYEPSPRAVMSLYSKLGSILQPDEVKSSKEGGASGGSSRHKEANSAIHVQESGIEKSGPDVDLASSTSLAEIGDVLSANEAIREVYGRTPASKFIIAKKVLPKIGRSTLADTPESSKREEVYMLVGRKDASLTDAEHAMRLYIRGRADVAS